MNREETAQARAKVEYPVYLLGRTELDAVADDTKMDPMEVAVPVPAFAKPSLQASSDYSRFFASVGNLGH